MEGIKKTYDFYLEKYNKQMAEVRKTMEMLNNLADDLQIARPFQTIGEEKVEGGTPQEQAGSTAEEFLRKIL